MFNTQMNEKFLRDDIYYCNCCGKFFSDVTDEEVQVPFEEMPADLAIRVMSDRQNSEKDNYRTNKLREEVLEDLVKETDLTC